MEEVTSEILRSIRKTQGLMDEPSEDAYSGRQKRSEEDSTQSDQPPAEITVQRLSAIEPLFSTCDNAIHVSTTVFNGITVAACTSGAPRPSVTVGELSLSALKFTPRHTIENLLQPQESAIFEDRGQLYVMVADLAKSDGVRMFVIDKTFHMTTEHVTNANYPTSVVVWKPNSDGPYHMAIGSSPDPRVRRSTYKNETFFYKFTGSYFDHYASVDSFLVKDICPFSEGGKDYVVIVNSEATPKAFGTQVDSELFRFDADNKKWISIQKIKTTGAVDCEIFSMGSGTSRRSDSRQETFLAIANQQDRTSTGILFQVDSVVYKFANERFIPFQCLRTVSATSIKAIATDPDTGKFALAVAHLYGVQMYQYNGWKFIPTSVQYTRGALGPGVSSLAFGTLGPEPVLIVSNPLAHREKSVIKFEFLANNVLGTWRQDSLRWCEAARSVNVKQNMDRLEEALQKDVFLVDQQEPIRIRGNLQFKGDVDVTGVFSAPAIHNVEENESLNHTMTRELDSLDRELHLLEQQAEATTALLEKALRLDRPHQVVTGQYVFNNELDLACGSGPLARSTDQCRFSQISANALNGKDVRNLANEVIRIDRDLQINRNDFFFKHIEVTKDLNVMSNGLVNGVNMSQVVTKTGTHFIEAPTVVSGPVSCNDIAVSGLINGLLISNNTILLKKGDQSVRSSLVFKSKHPDTVTAQTLFVNRVNNLPLDDFLSKIVTTDGNYVISGRKKFTRMVVNNNLELAPGSTLAGIDIMELWKNVLWTQGDQDIRAAHVTFTHLSVRGDLNVGSGRINGVRVPNDQMVINRRGKPVIITGQKIFTAPFTRVDHMHVQKSLNGLSRVFAADGNPLTTEWAEQLDILVKSLSQTIPNHKTFVGPIHLGGHSAVQGEVNGIDLSLLERTVLKHNETNLLSGKKVWTFEGTVTFKDRVTVKGLVDDVNLTSLYMNSLKLNDAVVHNFAQNFHFRHLHAPTIKCSRVNGLVLERDLMTRHTKQAITGTKTFPKGLHVIKDFTITGTLNGLSMQFLNDSLLRSASQRIWGPKTIMGDLHVTNLVTSHLNGIDMSNDLVLINSTRPQMIAGRKTFRSVTVQGNLNVKSLEVAGKINGIGFHDLIHNTLLYDAPQLVTGLKHFDHVTVPKDSNLEVTTLNEYNLKELVSDAVLIDVPQSITGNKVFKSPEVRFSDLRFHSLFDGVSDAEMRGNWLLQGVDQDIRGDLVFADAPGHQRRRDSPTVVVKGNLIISNGTVNGIDLRALDNDIVKVNEPAVVEGPVTFKGRVVADGEVAVAGRVQGVKLSQEAVLRTSRPTGPIRIFGYKTFKKNVLVKGDLKINGYVDGVLVSELCNNAVRVNGDQEIRAPVTIKGSLSALMNLTTGGRVDGVNVQGLSNMCVMRSSAEQVVRGKKHFKTLILSAASLVRGKFGGVDLQQLHNDYMSLSRDQVVTTPLVFMNGAKFASEVIVAGNVVTRDGLIRTGKPDLVVNLKEIDKNTLKTDGDQVISSQVTFRNDVHFAKNLHVNNTRINGVPFDWLVVKTKPKQEIRAPVVFEDLNIERNLQVAPGARVQGTDLSHVRRSQVPLTGHQDIRGRKHFSAIEVDHLIVQGRMNGVQFNEQNVLLSGAKANQVISGSFAFDKDVRILSTLSTKKVNNIDLVSLRSRLLQNGIQSNDTIYGRKIYLGKVTADQTWTMSLVDNVKINDLNAVVHDKRYMNEIQSVEKKLEFQESKLRKMEHVLENQIDCVDHYTLSHTLNGSLLPASSLPGTKDLVFTRSEEGHHCSSVHVYQMPAIPVTRITNVFDPRAVADFSLNQRRMIAVVSGPVTNPSSICGIVLPEDMSGKSIIQLFFLNPTAAERIATIPLNLWATEVRIASSSPTEVCLLYVGAGKEQVVCFDGIGKVTHTKEMAGSSASGVAIVRVEAEQMTFAAVSAADDIRILNWNPSTRSVDQTPLQKILLQTPEPGSRPVIHFTCSKTSPVFLIVAEPASKRIRHHQPLIRIFQHETQVASLIPFTETQQISETSDVQAIESLTIDSELLVFLLMADGRIRILRLAGSSGLVPSDVIEGQSVANEPVIVAVPSGAGHAVVVSQSLVAPDGYTKQASAKVLMSVLRNRYRPSRLP